MMPSAPFQLQYFPHQNQRPEPTSTYGANPTHPRVHSQDPTLPPIAYVYPNPMANPQPVIPPHLRPYEQTLVPVIYIYPLNPQTGFPPHIQPPEPVPVIYTYSSSPGQNSQPVIPPHIRPQGIRVPYFPPQ